MKMKPYLYCLTVVAGLLVIINMDHWFPTTSDKTDFSKQYYQICSLAEGCVLDTGKARVLFNVLPASLPALEALELDVVLEGINAEQVSVEFMGRDMPMGLMPVILKREGYGWLSQHYTGVGSISFCASDRQMVWVARLSIKTAVGLQTVAFELQPAEGLSSE